VVTDAVSIAAKADAVLWVSQAGEVARPHLARANHIIERNGMPVIGFVVNRLRRNLERYDYGYEYGYGNYEEEESHGS
jgi:Mrp family chromosome partitioning ATPase